MNRNRSIWIGTATLLLFAAACGAGEAFPVLHNEAISVRVLDGKDGKPQAHAHVVLAAGYQGRDLDMGLWREETLTDSEGLVHLSNSLKNLPLLRIEVLKRRSCQTDADRAAFSVDRIRRDGLSTANRCGTAVAADGPGMFTVYVKPAKPRANVATVAIP